LLAEIESKAQTVVNPPLADLAQSAYRPVLGQGVCDIRQAGGIRDCSKTVSVLGEGDVNPASLAGKHTHGRSKSLGKGWMPADLDRQMTWRPRRC
jgi:hypothetical protein